MKSALACVACAQRSSFIMILCSSPNWEHGGGPSQPGWLPYGPAWTTDGDAGGAGACAAQRDAAVGAFTLPCLPLPSGVVSPPYTTASKTETSPPAARTLPILSDRQLQQHLPALETPALLPMQCRLFWSDLVPMSTVVINVTFRLSLPPGWG